MRIQKQFALVLAPALLVFVVALAPSSISSSPSAINVGDVASYTWHAPLMNGMGLTSLDELRGKPVLLDFWGWH